MGINLMYYYDLTDGGKYLDHTKVHFSQEGLDESIDEIRNCFVKNSSYINDVEIKVFIQNDLNVRDSNNDDVRCMITDIKNENSCTYKLMSPLFDIEDSIDKKISMLRCLLENYFITTRLQNTWANDENYVEGVGRLLGAHNFKYRLPKQIAVAHYRRYNNYGGNIFKLSEMTPEELIKYVVPMYYSEIGYEDMQFLRDNAEMMAKLSDSWLEI